VRGSEKKWRGLRGLGGIRVWEQVTVGFFIFYFFCIISGFFFFEFAADLSLF
jgi:hypothetical protein